MADFFHTEKQKRWLKIIDLLRHAGEGGLTRKQICSRLLAAGYSTSAATFKRDMKEMRDDWGAPIGYEDRPCNASEDGRGHTAFWLLRDLSWNMEKLELTDDLLFSLLVAREVVERYAGHPLAQELRAAYDKLGEVLNEKITVKGEDLAPVSFLPDQPRRLDDVVWKPVLRAAVGHKMLKLTYVSKWKKKTSRCRIHPYHIVNLYGTWYLIGSTDETDMKPYQYSLSGVLRAEVLEQPAIIPDDFDIEDLLDHEFGRFLGDPSKEVTIRLRFNKGIAPLIESQWVSRRQRRRKLANGDIELSFPVSGDGVWPLYHVKSWVLSWGADCEVLEPAGLRNDIRESIEKMSTKTRP